MSSYGHFVGGRYDSPTRFVNEAKRVGWSRNVNALFARGLHYRDRIVFMRLRRDKSVQAFAEGSIGSITFKNPALSSMLGAALMASSQAQYSPSPLSIQRECGSYNISGEYTVSPEIDIPQIVAMALRIAKEHNLDTSCMIGGSLVREYKPVILQPAPKFTRGFIRIDDDETFEAPEQRSILAIENYRKK